MASSTGYWSLLPDCVRNNYISVASVVSVGIGLVLIRQLVKGRRCHSKRRLDGKFAIVTGANTGIGKETVRELALRGARVMIACRDPLKGAAAADDIYKMTGQRLIVKTLDLADLSSVRRFARDINEEEPRLDILVNNAGVMMCPQMKSAQGFELQFATNHLGHFLLTNLLLDLMKKSSPSRIVNVSSRGHRIGKIHFDDINMTRNYDRFSAYGQSKLANILFSKELSRRLQGSGVTTNSLHPGVINSNLDRHLQDSVPWFLRFIVLPLYYLVKIFFIKTVDDGAQTSLYCAVAEELDGVSGKYFSDCQETLPYPRARDEETARRLWTLSEEMVGLTQKSESDKSQKASDEKTESHGQSKGDKSPVKPARVSRSKSGSVQTTV